MVNRSRIAVILAATALFALGLTACGGDGDSVATTAAATTAPATTETAGAAGERPPLAADKTYALVFETNQGSFTITVDQKTSPNVSASMVALARDKFFDGTICHRIVPGFVVQCGDPTGTGTGGPGYSTQDTVPANARYVKGVVAMAKTQAEPPGTSGSQFFIVTGDDVGLPPEYALLGKVTAGLPVVEKIGRLGDPATEEPTEEVKIEKVTVEES